MDASHLILGAGCAGLSFAVQLAMRPRRERGTIVVLDQRSDLRTRDRTWCSFGPIAPPFDRCVTDRWPHWSVRDQRRIVRRSACGRAYEHVPSDLYSECALELLQRSDGVEVRTSSAVEHIDAERDSVRVRTGEREWQTRMVWDARGGSPSSLEVRPKDVCWLQHFVGWEVRTTNPIFDSEEALLMDFRVEQSRGPHFVYVLPFGRDRALVEDTYFGPTRFAEVEYESTIRSWLEDAGAGPFEIERRESGAIPMTTAEMRPPSSPRVVPLGLRGALAKPSSGYAFSFIQRHSRALSEVAGDGTRPPPGLAPRSNIALFFDRVFLSYMAKHPQSAPEVFVPFFAKTPADSLARFLSEEGTLRDHMHVIQAVPRLGVGLEALRSRSIWLR